MTSNPNKTTEDQRTDLLRVGLLIFALAMICMAVIGMGFLLTSHQGSIASTQESFEEYRSSTQRLLDERAARLAGIETASRQIRDELAALNLKTDYIKTQSNYNRELLEEFRSYRKAWNDRMDDPFKVKPIEEIPKP